MGTVVFPSLFLFLYRKNIRTWYLVLIYHVICLWYLANTYFYRGKLNGNNSAKMMLLLLNQPILSGIEAVVDI